MAWRDLAIVGALKKIFTHKTPGGGDHEKEKEEVVVEQVKVVETIVPEPSGEGALVVKETYSVTTVVEEPSVTPEVIVKKEVSEKTAVAKPTQKDLRSNIAAKTKVTQKAPKSAEAKKATQKVEAKEENIEAAESIAKPTTKSTVQKVVEMPEQTEVKEIKKEVAKIQKSKAKTKTAPSKTIVKTTKAAPQKMEAVKETPKSTEAKKTVAKTSAQKKAPVKAVKKETTAGKAKTAKSTTTKAPSKREQKLKLYHADIMKHLGSVDDQFLGIIVKNLGPSIYNKDAETVACSDPKELDTVKNNFLVRKLKMSKTDKDALDKAVAEVCEKLKGVKNKYRATFYYMLAKNLKRESKLR